ncbi:MAG: 50S ribosomal protein L20 [Candidatus Paceibacteria bacterium]
MARIKRGTTKTKKRRTILKAAKGFRFARSKKKRAAKEALLKARSYAFRDRKNKKRTMRSLAIVKVNAAVRALGFKNYSTFIGGAKKKGIELNRTVLAQLAEHHPEAFERTLKEMAK